MNRLIGLFYVCLLIFSSCSQYDDIDMRYDDKHCCSDVDHHIPFEKALCNADEVFQMVSPEMTRKTSHKTVKSVDCYPSKASVRSGSQELLYFVNYNEGGFAVLGADDRVVPVYAISDTGEFVLTEDSPVTFQTVCGKIIDDAISRRQQNRIFGSETDDLELGGIPNFNSGPFLGLRQNRIGFNNCSSLTVNKWGNPALTCCVPIAVEMVMSHYKWPEYYEGYSFNWDNINSGNDEEGLARMIAILSNSKHCNVQHNDLTHIGSAEINSVITALHKCGYKSDYQWNCFEDCELKALVNLGYGNILLFKARHPDDSPYAGGGHTWVIDGVRTYQAMGVGSDGQDVLTRYYYYHCVWGDHGFCNGYYYFPTSGFSGIPADIDEVDSGDFSYSHTRIYSRNTICFLDPVTVKTQ